MEGYINRYLSGIIEDTIEKARKSVLIYGPRQVGKTTFAKTLIRGEQDVYFNCDLDEVRKALVPNSALLRAFVGSHKRVVIDEAQRIENSGIVMKIFIDTFPDTRFIITGSSALELAYGTFDSLTGRVFTYLMYPVSTIEIVNSASALEARELLDARLRFGSYPALFNLRDHQQREKYIDMIAKQYLFKDTLSFEMQKSPGFLSKLAALLAARTGSLVSYNSLSNDLNVGRNTVERYLHLFTQLFIIVPLHAYHNNFVKRLTKQNKFYFIDVGIRNALIESFGAPDARSDIGGVWENFIIIERMKRNEAKRIRVNYYFYRGENNAEIDLVEERDGKIECFEIKYTAAKPSRGVANAAQKELRGAHLAVINRDNFSDFIS